jgi:magnesium transporter
MEEAGEDKPEPPPPVEVKAGDAAPVPAPLPEDPSANALRGALREGRTAEVVAALARLSPGRRAERFIQLRPPEQKTVLAAAPPELAASILSDCDSAILRGLLLETEPATMAPALRLVPPDNLADLLIHLPEERAKELLAVLDDALREEVKRLLTFAPETAGGLMTPRYLSVPDVVTVARALEILRSGGSADSPSYVYIVDANGRLAGVAPLRRLLMAQPRTPVGSIMVKSVVRLRASDPLDALIRVFNEHHYVSLPVVDDKDRLIGVVTSDDVLGAMRRAEGEVIRGVTGADPREAVQETLAVVRSRIPWVTVTIVGGLGCALIGALFQRALEEIVTLGLFVPVVLALGESVGAQTISVALSAMAGGTIPRGELGRFVLKELRVGVLVGLYAGLAVSATSLLWHGDPRLGVLIGGAILVSVSWAALLAVVVPSAMRRFRLNPVIASGPLVLILADLSTLLVYFGGATLFFRFLR